MELLKNYNKIVLLLFIVVFAIFFYVMTSDNDIENFEVLLMDRKRRNMKILDLNDFFKFIEFFMVSDMNQNINNSNIINNSNDVTGSAYYPSCYVEGESILISNNIRNLLKMLHFIVNVNYKDNFYHRILITKTGPNLQKFMQEPRRLNYEELVNNRIGKQFTFLKETELDKYYPRPNIDSKFQNPLPFNINVHNYYTYENTEVNLITLQTIIDLTQQRDISLFEQNVRPTEHVAFKNEFLVPVQSIINSMLEIINTNTYKNYIHNMRFNVKYRNFI